MKLLHACIIISAVLLVLVTGCTTQNQAVTSTSTPVPTTEPTSEPTVLPDTSIQAQNSTPITDPVLFGTWYLKLMSEQNGTALVQTINPQITVFFDENLNINGNSGCNNYNGVYTLTDKTTPYGKEITIGTLATTKMICNNSDIENTYLQILQKATSYLVNVNQELSIVDNAGNTLVYQRTPYSETAVPRGS